MELLKGIFKTHCSTLLNLGIVNLKIYVFILFLVNVFPILVVSAPPIFIDVSVKSSSVNFIG